MEFLATPHDKEKSSFVFSSVEELESKLQENNIEEVSVSFHYGESWEEELFDVCKPSQSEIEDWIDSVSGYIETVEDAALAFYRIAEGSEQWKDVISRNLKSEGAVTLDSLRTYTENYLRDCWDLNTIPSLFKTYFDYASFEKDLLDSGDVDQFEFDGQEWLYIP